MSISSEIHYDNCWGNSSVAVTNVSSNKYTDQGIRMILTKYSEEDGLSQANLHINYATFFLLRTRYRINSANLRLYILIFRIKNANLDPVTN
jgi:hypothetical protein